MNGKNESCRLCRSEGDLRASHILPEFLYGALYDEKHRMLGVKPESNAKHELLQKGIREYLLCAGCEQHLSRYERYAAEVLRGLPDLSQMKAGGVAKIPGVDYASFKLFQLSLLWRAGVSRQASFDQVRLGEHEVRLRKMILTNDPGKPLDYGCVLIRPMGEPISELIKFPIHSRLLGHHAYQMVVWALIWIYVVSSHSTMIHEQGSFLGSDGTLPICIGTTTGSGFMAGLGRSLNKIGALGN